MAQIAQKRLYFEIAADGTANENVSSDLYIDLAACLTAVNRKQYHQFTAKGEPLCYTVTITNLKSAKPMELCTAPNTWTTSNAAKKTAVGWKKQLKNSGIRMSELPTYARRFRCAFDSDAVTASGISQNLQNQLIPDGCDGSRLFTPYDAPDGTSITFETSNEVSLLALEDGATAYRPVLVGDTASVYFGMCSEYLLSRRNMREESDPTTEFPDSTGLMNTLFTETEVLSDDVTAAASGYNIARPYSESDAPTGVMAAIVTSNTTNYRESFSVPLGLMKFVGDFTAARAGDQFFIDVEAVYEM